MADVAVIINKLSHEKRLRIDLPLESEDETGNADSDIKPLQLAILGRQHVGKYTLVSTLLKEERFIARKMPGLTRDYISVT